jgi:hypothetical protein
MPEDLITPSAEPAPEAAIPLDQVMEQVFGKDTPDAPAPGDPALPAGQSPGGSPSVVPLDERVSAKIAAGLRAEKRAAEARRADQERSQAHQRELAQLEAKKAEVAEQLRIAEAVKAAKGSPSKVIEMLGYQPKDFFDTLANENEPHAVAQRAVSVEQAEREKLAATVKALEEKLAAKEKAEVQSRTHAEDVAAQRGFFEHVKTNAEKYPNLTEEFTPAEIIERAWKAASQHAEPYKQRFGVYPDDDVIAEHLEQVAAKRREERTGWRAPNGSSAPNTARMAEQPGEHRASQTERGPSPRTLSSRQTGQRNAAPRTWTQEGADEECLRILRGAVK